MEIRQREAKGSWQGTTGKYRIAKRGQLLEGLENPTEELEFYLLYIGNPFKVPEQGCRPIK